MVNYVCRTCLYVCANEFSFRKLEKVKPVLELFIPEIKSFVGKYSLICEQCYYFLKNVEKFKLKCMETQNKLYSMNLKTITETHDAVLRSVANDISCTKTLYQRPLPSSGNLEHLKRSSTFDEPRPTVLRSVANEISSTKIPYQRPLPSSSNLEHQKRSSTFDKPKKSNKKAKQSRSTAPVSPDTTDITLTSLLRTSEPYSFSNQKSNNCSTGSDDLMQLLNYRKDSHLQGFREFAIKPAVVESRATISNKELVMNYNDEVDTDNDAGENDEYLMRPDLVTAADLDVDQHQDGQSEDYGEDDDLQIIEMGCSEGAATSSGGNAEGIKSPSSREQRNTINNGLKASSNNYSGELTNVLVKKENIETDNPGFFNKQSSDGFYNCRLCQKHYKTSKGLYNHTKEKHRDQIKFHHCEHCSFFTLWKSALVRHYTVFHGDICQKTNPSNLKCYHCSFECRSKEQLGRHILDSHVYEKFTRCPLCRARFSDNILFAQHVEKEHIGLDMSSSSNYCPECYLLFLTEEDYENHATEKHGGRFFCGICNNSLYSSKEELQQHQRSAHTSFVASVVR